MGAVIGKGGETIRELQEEHGVSINSLQGRSAFRVSGDDPEGVDAAVAPSFGGSVLLLVRGTRGDAYVAVVLLS